MSPVLIVFAKYPVPGSVKTRIALHCGNDAAAELAATLMIETAKLVVRAWPGPRVLYCWPDTDEALFKDIMNNYDFRLASQSEGSLGDKMYDAMQKECRTFGSAAIIGTDVPHCPAEILGDTYEYLSQGKSVIGPASDGGYYLIGLQHPEKRFFENIEWGGNSVFASTLDRAKELDIDLDILPVVRDIDDWQDLVAVAGELPVLQNFISRY